MRPRISTGDQDAVLRQIRWCAAVQTLVNCHCKLEENPVRDVEPMQLVVQYLTRAAIKLPSAGDNTRSVHIVHKQDTQTYQNISDVSETDRDGCRRSESQSDLC